MAIPGHEFLTAHYSNNERTIVEAYWTTPDGKETRVEYIEAKGGDVNWENLLTHIDVDTLHEATYKHIKHQNAAFEKEALQIAKDQGILQDFDDKQLFSEFVVKKLFQIGDESEMKNSLFVFNPL